MRSKVYTHLTGQVVAAYSSRERIYAFPTKDVGRSRERDFAKLNLHLGIFEHPLEKILFQQPVSSLIVRIGWIVED
jgi:hypothetical protein